MSQFDDIRPGARLRCRGADGQWREKVATSSVEGCYDVDGHRKHDFAGVYVRPADRPDLDDDDGVFWPLEDVESRSMTSDSPSLVSRCDPTNPDESRKT